MRCPHCSSPDSRVIEIKTTPDYDQLVRECRKCRKTFATLERVTVHPTR